MEILRADRIARMLLVTRDRACEIREARSSREDDSPPPPPPHNNLPRRGCMRLVSR